jgi:hypothetical protein
MRIRSSFAAIRERAQHGRSIRAGFDAPHPVAERHHFVRASHGVRNFMMTPLLHCGKCPTTKQVVHPARPWERMRKIAPRRVS